MKTTYRAAFIPEPCKFEIKELEMPLVLRPGYFMSDVNCASICGTDRPYFKNSKPSVVAGHELCATVTDPGDTDLKVGDRVAMYPGVPCWECATCREGKDNICSVIYSRDFSGISYNGGYAEKYSGPAKYAVKVPENVSSEAAAMAEPVAVAYHAVRKSNLKVGDKVLVIGAGIIGLLCAEWAKIAGASFVAVSEYNSKRLASAKKVGGLDAYFEASDEDLVKKLKEASGSGFDVVFECSASPAGYANAASVTKPGHDVIMVGTSATPIGIVLMSFIMKEISIVPAMGYTFEEYKDTMNHIAAGDIDPCKYVSRVVPLDEIQTAFEQLFNNPDNADIKILVKPN